MNWLPSDAGVSSQQSQANESVSCSAFFQALRTLPDLYLLGIGRGAPFIHFSRWQLRDSRRWSYEEGPHRTTFSDPRSRFLRKVHQTRVPPAGRVQLLLCKCQGHRGQRFPFQRRVEVPACRRQCADPTTQGPTRRSGLAATKDWRRGAGRPCNDAANTRAGRGWRACSSRRRFVPAQLLDRLSLLLDSLRGWTMPQRVGSTVFTIPITSQRPFPLTILPSPI